MVWFKFSTNLVKSLRKFSFTFYISTEITNAALKMVEEQKARLEDAMRNMMEDLYKKYIRKLEGNMYTCSATCCNDKEASVQSVQRCVDNCGNVVRNVQNFVQQEINYFQERLQRCVISCNDSIRDKMQLNSTEAEKAQYTGEFEKCAIKCVDTHLALIPKTSKKIKDYLEKETH